MSVAAASTSAAPDPPFWRRVAMRETVGRTEQDRMICAGRGGLAGVAEEHVLG